MKDQVCWFVPFREHLEQAKRDMAAVLPPGALVRITLVVLVCFGAIHAYATRRVPELEFDWVNALLICMVSLVVLFAVCVGMTFMPPHITVSNVGILVSQGQAGRLYRFSELAEIRLRDGDGQSLCLSFRLRDTEKTQRYPLGPKVPVEKLRELLAR